MLASIFFVIAGSSTWLSLVDEEDEDEDDNDEDVDETVERDWCERLLFNLVRPPMLAWAPLLLVLLVAHEQVHEKCPYGEEIAIGWMKCDEADVVVVGVVLCGLVVGETDVLEQGLTFADESVVVSPSDSKWACEPFGGQLETQVA